jgi:transposase-like protein
MTEQQLKQARMMHDAGVNYSIIASHYNICPTTLRKKLKAYDNKSEIHSTTETS